MKWASLAQHGKVKCQQYLVKKIEKGILIENKNKETRKEELCTFYLDK